MRRSKTAYVIWSAIEDEQTCDVCASLDGSAFLPKRKLLKKYSLPASGCKNKECRCIYIYVPKDDLEAADTAEFIRRAGGKVTSEQLAEYDEAKLKAKFAPVQERREKEHLATENALEAHDLEKDHPEEAIALYRESIAIHKEVAENSPDEWSWRDFPYLYNRLTLVLERFGWYEDALREIGAYEALPCRNEGTKSDRDAIERRKVRLQKELG